VLEWAYGGDGLVEDVGLLVQLTQVHLGLADDGGRLLLADLAVL
jgi:hypothetical protein